MNDMVVVNEVGLRDGLQNQPAFVTTADKLALVRALIDAGVRDMEVTSFVSPRRVPQMADAEELLRQVPRSADVSYAVLVPNVKGYERAVAAGARTVVVVVSATETMNQKNIGMSLPEVRGVARQILELGARDHVAVKGYVAVAFECPFEGKVDPAVVEQLTGELFDNGAPEVIVTDTIGAASPTQSHELFSRLAHTFGPARLTAHFHDTRAMALANVWAALQAGIRRFDSSIGGLGGCPFSPGSAGNVATEDVVLLLNQCGYRTGIEVEALLPAIDLASRLTGRPLGGRAMTWFRSRGSACPTTAGTGG